MNREIRQPLQRAVVVAHPSLPEASAEAGKIAAYLAQNGVQAVSGLLYDEALHCRVKDCEFDFLVALGGDGTMLRAGHLCGPLKIPVLGINLGRFGFLMEIQQNQWQDFMPCLLSGDYWLEKRMMLNVVQWRAGEKLGSWDVLNEVVVSRGQFIRPVHLTAHVDGRFLTTYVADALIVATPTGSTAYAMAVGGPILSPELRNIVLAPVAPHLSFDRTVVLAESARVNITVRADHHAVFSADGQVPVGLSDDDRVEIEASKHSVQFIRFQDPGYFYRNLTPHMNRNPAASTPR